MLFLPFRTMAKDLMKARLKEKEHAWNGRHEGTGYYDGRHSQD